MKKKFILLTIILSFLLCACGNYYSEDDLEEARRQAYNEGYNDGYSRGSDDQREADCEEFLIDGTSIRDIVDEVYDEFGITPREAFSIVDEYEYDYTHGGFTRAEYKKAIEVMYWTASSFPSDY